MSVLLDTSVGEIVIDLYCKECPLAAKNFLKLCKCVSLSRPMRSDGDTTGKIKYYNGCLFYNVQQNFIAQTGDPTGTGSGGTSIYGLMYGAQATSFENEIHKHLTHNKTGVVSMAGGMGTNESEGNRSQFFFTLRGEDMEHLDGKHTIFGEVAEGLDVLQKINELYTDEDSRPFQDVRIRHTYVLEDEFSDPTPLAELIPPASPTNEVPSEEKVRQRIAYEENIGLDDEKEKETEYELEQRIKRKEAESREIVLEMTGDIPSANVKPPAEVLFVAKLNPVTTDDDLELIFSRFGPIKDCSIIRDYKTGDSLNYAFIEFETEDAVLEAYEKMDNVLIDDRRIKVDFSQSVAKLWNKYLLKPHSQQQQQKGQEQKALMPKSQAPTKESYSRSNRKERDHGRDRSSGRRYSDTRKDKMGGRYRQRSRSHSRDRNRNRSRSRERNRSRSHGRRQSRHNERESRSHRHGAHRRHSQRRE